MHAEYLARFPQQLRPDPLPRPESTWWSWEGADVHVERVGDPTATGTRAIFLHGAGGHAAALWPYVAAAAARGAHIVVPDLPGYGRTRAPHLGAVRYQDWVRLACDLIREEREGFDGRLVLVGASMGGMLAYDAATRTGLVDGVVATCLLDPRRSDARRCVGVRPWIGTAAPLLLAGAVGPLGRLRLPMRWLTRMRAIANSPGFTDLVLHDARGGGNRMPLGFVRSFLRSAPAVEPEDASLPWLVLAHPDEDRWTPLSVSRGFFDRLACPKELVVLEGAGHFPIELPGAAQLVDVIGRAVAAEPDDMTMLLETLGQPEDSVVLDHAAAVMSAARRRPA